MEMKGSNMDTTIAKEEKNGPQHAATEDESRGLVIFISALMFGVWLIVLGAHL